MRRLKVTMSARVVVSAESPWQPRGAAFADPGVALDEVLSLRADVEPLVLRVTAVGGTKEERGAVAGDWLCDGGGAEPVRVPPPRWSYSREATAWARGRTWVDAWEGCARGDWMIHEAASVGADPRSVVMAACACLRTTFRPATLADARLLRAVELAEGWVDGTVSVTQLRSEYVATYRIPDAPYFSAARAAHLYTSRRTREAAFAAADAVSWVAAASGEGWSRTHGRLAALVRQSIPTLAVLRAASSR